MSCDFWSHAAQQWLVALASLHGPYNALGLLVWGCVAPWLCSSLQWMPAAPHPAQLHASCVLEPTHDLWLITVWYRNVSLSARLPLRIDTLYVVYRSISVIHYCTASDAICRSPNRSVQHHRDLARSSVHFEGCEGDAGGDGAPPWAVQGTAGALCAHRYTGRRHYMTGCVRVYACLEEDFYIESNSFFW